MVKLTNDGSDTLYSNRFKEHYHSTQGAVQESKHVYINAGFNFIEKDEIAIFELGFGTGLNAILTYIEAEKNRKKVNYITIERHPVEKTVIEKLNYTNFLNTKHQDIFNLLHKVEWERSHYIDENFIFRKINNNFADYNFDDKIDLCYFDAFSYNSQPELWTKEIFCKIYNSINPQGVLTTYASKGIIKQNLKDAGFTIKRLKGASGKWHMLRAVK